MPIPGMRLRRRALAAAAALLALHPVAALAQEDEPRPSQRVRVLAPGEGWISPTPATVVEADAETLLLDVGGVQMQVRRVTITRLEVSDGKRNRVLWGAYGGALGAVLGYAAGRVHQNIAFRDSVRVECVPSAECPRGFRYAPRKPDPRHMTAITAAGGTIGAVVGVALPGERWRDISLRSALLPAEPRRGRLALAVGVRF
ncbi:MAG: hypothetical protein KY467_13970 [Gemmatimonadetes bacterium]|nr:hypothetical protein [Gemmatimonadota bacterium]